MKLALSRVVATSAALVAVCFCVGCLPHRYTSAIGVSGRVMDDRTGAPVKEASVALTPHEGPCAVTHTSEQGLYCIPSQQAWYIAGLLSYTKRLHVPTAADVSIRHQGYEAFTTTCWDDMGEKVDMGTIRLKPLSR